VLIEPKGVMVTHGNLAHNLALISAGIHLSPSTVVVSWLPHYHDMGLIGSYCGAMYCGGTGYYFSPIDYIRDPTLWIRVISEYRGTHMQAPNFSYKLTAKKFLDLKLNELEWIRRLDLSCVYHMINAAEPVDSQSIDSFVKTFETYGLNPAMIYPTYGLAEHTVYVSSNGKQRLAIDRKLFEEEKKIVLSASDASSPLKSLTMIGCGSIQTEFGIDLCIVDPVTRKKLGEDVVGEVWIHSPSCALGYYKLSEISKNSFMVTLADDDDGKGIATHYLRTGDSGFIHNHELFICGRIKDMIILRGKNFYPQVCH
jgi:acyl-CoA synthetase (AMP-forming)/AMP-acid ligase II